MKTASQATVAFLEKIMEKQAEENVCSYLNSEVELNLQFDDVTPFTLAIINGYGPNLIEKMIALGADPFTLMDGSNSLEIAALFNQKPEVIKILAKQGFNQDTLTNALFLAAAKNPNPEVLKEIIKFDHAHRESCDYSDENEEEYQFQVLTLALQNPNPEVFFALCEAGFNVNLLLNDENINVFKDLRKVEPDLFPRIVKIGDILLDMIPDYLVPLGHVAMFCSDTWLLSELLLAGADPNQESGNAALPLFLAIYNVNGNEVSLKIIQCLLENGADINLFSSNGLSTLLFAVLSRNQTPELLEFLLQSGADVNAIAENGKNVLHLAIEKGLDDRFIKLLLSAGANMKLRNAEGVTPMHMAIAYERPSIMKLFIDSGFRFDENFCEFGTPLHYALEVFDDEWVTDEDDFQEQSRDDSRVEIIELLVKNGIEVEKENKDGCNSLEAALSNINCGLRVAEKLIDLGADVNHISALNTTSLLIAAACRTSDFVKLLISKGADVNFIGDNSQP